MLYLYNIYIYTSYVDIRVCQVYQSPQPLSCRFPPTSVRVFREAWQIDWYSHHRLIRRSSRYMVSVRSPIQSQDTTARSTECGIFTPICSIVLPVMFIRLSWGRNKGIAYCTIFIYFIFPAVVGNTIFGLFFNMPSSRENKNMVQ